MRFLKFFFVISFVFTGCVTEGNYFSSETDWIKTGVTQKSQVKEIVGEPHSVGVSDGTKTWTYGYYQYRLLGDSYTKELKFYWNPDGTLQRYNFRSSFPRDKKNATDSN